MQPKKLVTQVAGFNLPYVLELEESNLVCRANRLLLVKCCDNKKVKSPYNWVIFLLTQPQVANQQQQQQHQKKSFDNQTPVFYLAIRHRSKDLKHLIPRTRLPGKQGQHILRVECMLLRTLGCKIKRSDVKLEKSQSTVILEKQKLEVLC